MITTLETCSLWDLPPNVPGASLITYFADVIGDVQWTERLDLNDECALRVPLTSRAAALARPQMILVLHFAPATPGGTGDYRLYRVSSVTEEASPSGITVALQARGLAFDLANAGRIRDVLSGGREEYTVAGTMTGSAWLNTYALPQLQRAGYTFYTVGGGWSLTTPLVLENATPGELVRKLVEFSGVEWDIILSGGQWVLVNLGNINAGLEPLRLTDGLNLRRVQRARSSLDQATVLEPTGGAGHSSLSRSIQHHAWQGSNFDTILKTMSASSMASDIGYAYAPIQFDGQWVGYFAQRQSTGRCFAVVDAAIGTPGTFTLEDLTNLNPGVVPDHGIFEFRSSRSVSPRLDVPTPGMPLRATSATGVTPITIDNPFTGADPVPTTDQHIDCRVAASSLIRATTCSNVANVAGSTTDQDITVASTTGVLVGHWGFLHNNVGTPWTLYGRPFTVVQLISSTVVRVRMRYPYETGRPLTAGATAKQAQFYQDRGNVSYVDNENAATNAITLFHASGTVVQNDLLEYHVDGGALVGSIPAPSSAPIGAGGFGVIAKGAPFSDQRCLRNLLHAGNPWFDDWAGGAGSAPDLWSVEHPFGGVGTPTKVTATLPGPGTVHAVGLVGATLASVASPAFWARPSAGDSKISLRVRLRTGSGAGWASSTGARVIIDVLPAGGTTVLGTASVCAADFPSPPAAYQVVDPDTVVDVDLVATDVLHTAAVGAAWAPWQGLKVRISAFGTGSDCTIGGVFVVQDETLPASPEMLETSDHALFGLAQLRLDTIDQPTETIDADAIDLSRLLVEQFGAAALVKGRRVQLEYEPLGLVIEDRIAALDFRAAISGEARVTVQTRTRDLAEILADQLASL